MAEREKSESQILNIQKLKVIATRGEKNRDETCKTKEVVKTFYMASKLNNPIGVRMVKLHKVRITVLRRFSPSEVFAKSPVTLVAPMKECGIFKDGQEFIVDGMKMPDGFCNSAWVSIYCNVRLLMLGGNLPWYKEKGVAINCCIDGLRPVIFKLERI